LFEAGGIYLSTPPTGLDLDSEATDRPVGPLGGEFRGERAAPVTELHRYGALAVGPLVPRSWRGGGEPADFFALKAVLESLALQLGTEFAFAPGSEPFLHPGRTASVAVGAVAVGWIGEVHPLVCRAWDVEAAVGFEIGAAPLLAAATAGEEAYEDVTTFPSAYQDLAVVVPAGVAATEVRAAILAAGGELLRSAEVFDLFEGEQLGEGRKSLALGLEFRAPDRTLTDEEVSGLRETIKAALEQIGGTLRE
jgi:phenylalanyl-tRNA synthetase beta chain